MNWDPLEEHLFFEGVYLKYGFDFRGYASTSLERRLSRLIERLDKTSPLELLRHCLSSKEAFREVLAGLTVNTTEFFRDPLFFKSLRISVFPVLETYASFNIWLAGCSTGEEVLSLCIALHEHGLLRRARIYASDINPIVLAKAKQGIYDASAIAAFNKNYVAAGGQESPSIYYTSDYGLVQFDKRLLKDVTFLDHNLATDEVFVEAQLILCRNVLIYFNRDLQERVLSLMARSLAYRGFLALGPKESLRFSPFSPLFEPIDREWNLFRLSSTERLRR